MDFHILKAERQNGIKKYEYSHDRICLAAKKHKEERQLRKQNKKMKMRIAIMFAFMIAIIASVLGGQYFERSRHHSFDRIIDIQKDSLENIIVRVQNSLDAERDSRKEMLRQIQDTAKKYNENKVFDFIDFVNSINNID